MGFSHQNSFLAILFGLLIEVIIAVLANLISAVAERYLGLNDISAVLFVSISLAIFVILRAFLLASLDIDTSFLEPRPIFDLLSVLKSLKRALILAWGHFVVVVGLAVTVGYAYFLYSYGIYPTDLNYRSLKFWLLLFPWLFIPLPLSLASQYREDIQHKALGPQGKLGKQPSTGKPIAPVPPIVGIQEGFVTFTITVLGRQSEFSQDDKVQISAAPSASIADAFETLNLTLLEPLDDMGLFRARNPAMFLGTEPWSVKRHFPRSAWTIYTGITSGIIDLGNIDLGEIVVPAKGYESSAAAIANHVYAVRSPLNTYGAFKIVQFDRIDLRFPTEYKMVIQLRYRADGRRNLGKAKLKMTEELIKRYEAGERNFKKEDLSEADLREVNLSGADLEGANLSEANLSKAILADAYLFNANLGDAYLEDCRLSKATLSQADLTGANLFRANLSEATLCEANLSRAFLEGADLIGANLEGANLKKAKLKGVDLEEAVLIEANLKEADLRGANLIKANLKEAKLIEANLVKAKLMGAILEGANLTRAYLIWANLEGADLTGANLGDAKVTDEQLKTAKSLKGATMPNGTNG